MLMDGGLVNRRIWHMVELVNAHRFGTTPLTTFRSPKMPILHAPVRYVAHTNLLSLYSVSLEQLKERGDGVIKRFGLGRTKYDYSKAFELHG